MIKERKISNNIQPSHHVAHIPKISPCRTHRYRIARVTRLSFGFLLGISFVYCLVIHLELSYRIISRIEAPLEDMRSKGDPTTCIQFGKPTYSHNYIPAILKNQDLARYTNARLA